MSEDFEAQCWKNYCWAVGIMVVILMFLLFASKNG